MARNYSSVASEKTLASTITNTATQITLNNVTNLPTPPYTLVIAPDTSNEEIITVNADQTGVTAPTLKVTRGQDGSTAPVAGHAAGTTVRHMITARDLQEPQDHIDNTSTAHGASGGVVGRTNTQTLTNKTIDLANNTVTGTLTQFNTALSGTNFVSTDGSETLTNKTLTSPTVSGLYLSDSSVVFEGSSADAYETTLTVTNPTADRTVTIPDVTGNVVTTGDTGTVTSTMIADGTIVAGDIADGTITSAKIADGTIVNADISATAAISWSKMATDSTYTYMNPPGMLAPYAGSSAPSGWFLCDGGQYSQTTYASLYAAIGTSYNTGGETAGYFRVPDLRGRVIAGLDNMGGTDAGRLSWQNVLGTVGASSITTDDGKQTHTLDLTEMPAHRHSWTYYDAASNTGDGGRAGARWDNSNDTEESPYTINTTYVGGQTPGSAGTTAAHNNMQPTILLNYIIKY